MPVLQAVGLGKRYQDATALEDLNLSIGKGDIFCLLGQNGAGKTTTINIFLGLIEASQGKALINGIEVRPNEQATKKMIAYIPEVVQLYGQLTGLENLEFFSRLAGFNYSDQLMRAFLSKSGLDDLAHGKPLLTYSKGMRQKVGIAIALAKNADVIFMDEPTSGLDPKATADFTAICKTLAAEGKTIFMATHDIFNAVSLGSRIGIMRKGQLVHTMETSEITAGELQKIYLETI